MIWSHQFPAQPLSPALSGTRVYVEQVDGTLSAFDIAPATPQLAWSLSVGSTSYGSPVVATNGTIITTAGRHVIGVADTGSQARFVWRYTTAAPIEVSAPWVPTGPSS